MIKSVRKTDLHQMLVEEISDCLKLKQSDFEININSIYAEVKIMEKALSYEKFCGDTILDKGYKTYLSKHLENLTNSNVKIALYYPVTIEENVFITRIKLSVNYQIEG